MWLAVVFLIYNEKERTAEFFRCSCTYRKQSQIQYNGTTVSFSRLKPHFDGIGTTWIVRLSVVFIYLLRMGECSCLMSLPQGRSGRVASAAGTRLSSSPHPGTGPAHRIWETPINTVNVNLSAAVRHIMYIRWWRLTQLHRRVAWKYLWISWSLCKVPKGPHTAGDLAGKDRNM